MKDLRIFISYSHDDETIATALSNLLQQAFGPALAEAFLDKRAISFGAGIKQSISDALAQADSLIAIITDANPASALSWPGWEIGRFSAYWDPRLQGEGHHKNRVKGPVIGQVVVLTNGDMPLGPEQGNRPVNLGITEALLAGQENDKTDLYFRKNAYTSDDLLRFLKETESLLRSEPDYTQFFQERRASLDEMVVEFKLRAFLELRRRVRHVAKPSKNLIVRYRGAAPSSQVLDLPDEAKIFSSGGASNVFGKREDDATLFRKSTGVQSSVARYETTWGEFKASVKNEPYGAYWCGVIEQAVIGARTEGTELDSNLVLISSTNRRHRVIATTVTTYFNNDAEVSLYLIEALQRRDRGDTVTSNLLNCLTIICRFRFAFLERASPYYWLNFQTAPIIPQTKAKDLLMELDYLKSEAMNANLEKPGAWEDFISSEQLTKMLKVWQEVDLELRKVCNAIIGQGDASADGAGMTTQLKRIFDEIKPFNLILGAAITKQLLVIFERELAKSEGQSAGAEV